jgi:hypothetical protein
MITNEYLITMGLIITIAWTISLLIYKAYQDSIKGLE